MTDLIYAIAPFVFGWRVYEALTTDPHATLNLGAGPIGFPGSLMAFNWALIGFFLFSVAVATLREIAELAAKIEKNSN